MNLVLHSETMLSVPFSASSKAALKATNDLFVVISTLKEQGKTNYLPIGSEDVFGRPASLNHEEPPLFREKIFKKTIKDQNFRMKG